MFDFIAAIFPTSDIFGCPDEASYYIFPGEETFTEDEKRKLREYIPNIWEDEE